MAYRIAADAVLFLHLGFILFVTFGGLFAFRFRWAPLFHLPAVLWGIFIEISGSICPLTPLENLFLRRSGEEGFTESFIDHYLIPLLYPAGLGHDTQLRLAGIVLVVNGLIYGALLLKRRISKNA